MLPLFSLHLCFSICIVRVYQSHISRTVRAVIPSNPPPPDISKNIKLSVHMIEIFEALTHFRTLGSGDSDDATSITLFSSVLPSIGVVALALRGHFPPRWSPAAPGFPSFNLTTWNISFLSAPTNISQLTLLVQFGSRTYTWASHSVQEILVFLLARLGEMEILCPERKGWFWAAKTQEPTMTVFYLLLRPLFVLAFHDGRLLSCVRIFRTQHTCTWICVSGGRG